MSKIRISLFFFFLREESVMKDISDNVQVLEHSVIFVIYEKVVYVEPSQDVL